MALSQVWKLQGTTATTIDSTDFIQFSDGTFDNPITVNSYNGGTHVRSSGGADDSSANSPRNVKYISSNQADWGDGTETVANITNAECTLDITISESVSISVTDISFYAYDGTNTVNAPVGMTVQAFEKGDTAWKQIHGSANALVLDNKTTPATSHHFYIALSASPTSVGVKSANKVRIEFTYQ